MPCNCSKRAVRLSIKATKVANAASADATIKATKRAVRLADKGVKIERSTKPTTAAPSRPAPCRNCT